MYDFVYRNRTLFKKDFQISRRNYGYRFENGEPLLSASSYHQFKTEIKELTAEYKYCLKFDIASYFNSVYHHDLINWLTSNEFNDDDIQIFDKFLKQINSGRSIDCLPHGMYSTKMIGSHFLKFIDNSARVKSEVMLRFMDDFVLFSNDLKTITTDFMNIQVMLGEKGLSVNSGKTKMGEIEELIFEKEIDQIKKGLLIKRIEFMTEVSTVEYEEIEESRKLNAEEEKYLISLLSSKNLEEEDAELALKLMREDSEKVIQYLESILIKFPNLAKSVFYFCSSLSNVDELSEIIKKILDSNEQLSEYQLFWFEKIAETYLNKTKNYGNILIKCFEHSDATQISKAKILEIRDKLFGLYEIRESNLRTGSSNWISWASAIGMLTEKKASRNHLLSYFANGSYINKMIKECLENMKS